MSGLSQYQSVFRIAKQEPAKNAPQPARVTKRYRQVVSCIPCRTRKLKCDRQAPCLGCSKRGEEGSCNYSTSKENERDGRIPKTSEAQLRLQKLEQMVSSLMAPTVKHVQNHNELSLNGSTVDQSLSDLTVDDPVDISVSGGHLDVQGSEINYVGATHWATILENIRDIQGFLDSDGTEEESTDMMPDDLAIIDANASLTLEDVFKSLPQRQAVDQLLSIYFHAGYLKSPAIHKGKFLKEYERFWANPSSVSFLWISMLFSILCIATQIKYGPTRDVTSPTEEFDRSMFLQRSRQALVVGKYHKPKPYSIESVLLYTQCIWVQKEDPDADAWVIIGVGTRLALRMGYHRDPRYLRNITPFEGEMRRRTFALVEVFDQILSFQAGLPAIIHEEECDVESPRNLLDEDFDEDCKILPPSRPPTDSTPILYSCCKSTCAKMLKRIVRHILSLKTRCYEDTLKLDQELQQMHADIPPSLRLGSLASSFTEPTHITLNRLSIEMLYLKCVWVLHRKYIDHDRSNPTYAYSRKTCIDAAIKTLNYQTEFYTASQPGGRFFEDKWIFSSLTLHDFLSAAMIVCLDLYESQSRPESDAMPTEDTDPKTQTEMYDAVQYSHQIWKSRRAFSRDARRASNVLAVMLSKISKPNAQGKSAPANGSRTLSNVWHSVSGPEIGTAASTETSSSGGSLWDAGAIDVDVAQTLPLDNHIANSLSWDAIDPMSMDFTESENIDWNWGFVDQYLFDRDGIADASGNWQLAEYSNGPSVM